MTKHILQENYERLFPINEAERLNEKTGGEKTYKSLMKLRTGIKDLEKTFKRDEKDMQRDRASKIESHIGDLQRAWAAIWSDFQGR